MSSEKNQVLNDLLLNEWDLLQAAVSTLQLSIDKCISNETSHER